MISTGSPNRFPNRQRVRAGKAGVRPFLASPWVFLYFELTVRPYRIRGLPRRGSPAVAPVNPPPATTVCPKCSSEPSPPSHLPQQFLATSCSPKIWQLLGIWSNHWWINSFHVRSFSAGWSTSETSRCSTRLRICVQRNQKICVLSRSFFHRGRKASGIIIRDGETGCVW